MRATGIVCRIDDLGRVVIPREICRTCNITSGDPLELYMEDNKIILVPYKIESPQKIFNQLKESLEEDENPVLQYLLNALELKLKERG